MKVDRASSRTNERILFAGPKVVRVAPAEPADVGPTDVMVTSVVSGISQGTEMAWYFGRASALRRRWDPASRVFDGTSAGRSYPVAPGYETVGRVVAIGSDVQSIEVGELVYLDRPHARLHVVEADVAESGRLTGGLPAEAGLFFPLARVALGAVHDADINLGDAVAVVGLGVVGLLATALARRAGADPVIGLDRYPLRLDAAKNYDAVPVDVERVGDPALAVRDHVGPVGVDVAIEASGSYEGLHQAIRCCRPGGRVVTAGSYHGQACGLSLGEEYHRNQITLASSMTVNGCSHRQAPRWDLHRLDATARRLIETGALPVTQLVTHRVPFHQAEAAYQLIADHPESTIKVVLTHEN